MIALAEAPRGPRCSGRAGRHQFDGGRGKTVRGSPSQPLRVSYSFCAAMLGNNFARRLSVRQRPVVCRPVQPDHARSRVPRRDGQCAARRIVMVHQQFGMGFTASANAVTPRAVRQRPQAAKRYRPPLLSASAFHVPAVLNTSASCLQTCERTS